tara:strand:- start:218 stop:640 length:423 start_codon:yes stop_codon:yes gene_type:complete
MESTKKEKRKEKQKKRMEELFDGVKFLYFRNFEINKDDKEVPNSKGGVTIAIKESEEIFQISICYCTIKDIFCKRYSKNRAVERFQIPIGSHDYLKYRHQYIKPEWEFGKKMFEDLFKIVEKRIECFPTPILVDLDGERI